jgi:nucleoside-diphosphate-sugar epimerase
MKNKTIIVTGATGFIGSNLTLSLIDKGFDVHILSRQESDLSILSKHEGNFTNHVYDGSIQKLKQTFKEVKPTHVFHLASLFLAKHDDSNISNLLESNIIFSTHIVEAMASNDVKYLINTGTSWQHFEDCEYNPVNLYAATKQSFETILEFYIQTSKIKVITLKLFDTYGANDPRKKILSLLGDYSKSGETLLMSPGEQIIDLVHIDDVIKAFELSYNTILHQTENHMQYGISSNHPISLKDLVLIFEETLNVKVKIDWGKREYRQREVMVPWTRSSRLPGWKNDINLKEGLLLTYR